MTQALDVMPKDLKTLKALLRRHLPGIAAWAYGSRVKWTSRPNSDLDVVVFAPPERRAAVSALRSACEESNLPFRVELFVWDEVPEPFRMNIENGHVVLQVGGGAEDIQPAKLAEWNACTLGDVITLQRGFDITRATQSWGTVPVVSSSGISSFHNVAMVKGPGVVLGRKGVVGSVYYVDSDFWPHDTTLWVKDFNGNYPRFTYYFFREMSDRLAAMDVGSANPTLNRNHVHPIEVFWPPVPEQRAIAGVLGALDDKIEQNRRTAQALEGLAQAIFHAWFVDFEPVKAKTAGANSFPSMPQEVFDALPTRFVDSEIGPVPEGWEVKAIGDVVTTKGGGTPSTKNPEFWDGGMHCWATPKDMSRLTHPVLLDTERRITDAGVASINSGVLPVGTVLMSSRAPVGYLAIAGVPTAINQGFIAMVCDGPLPPVYVLNWAFTSMDVIKAHASGTTFPEISKKSFRPLPIVQPTDDVIVAYQQVAEPLFDLLTACVMEKEKLAQMRDYLLPKLMSGEIRCAGNP